MKITVYDKPGTIDRYTVVIGRDFYGMSDNANFPNGFNQFCGNTKDGYRRGSHLGKVITDIPKEIQKAIDNRLLNYKTSLIDKVIPNVFSKRGAPMGRVSIGEKPLRNRIYDRYVPMCSCCGAYDVGGAYWGLGNKLRVSFSKDLTFIKFYRE